MKSHSLKILLVMIFLVVLLTGCSSVNSATSDLEDAGYILEKKDEENMNNVSIVINTVKNEYTILDDSGQFAGFMLEFSSNTAAQTHFDEYDYDARMDDEQVSQVFVVYKNLILAVIDYDVIEIITGEAYS